jgi:hypothetical protein
MSGRRWWSAVALGVAVSAGVTAMAAAAGAPPARAPAVPAAPAASAAPARSGSADAGTAPAARIGAEVMVLHATNADGGIDPHIGQLPQLRKPPFSAYNSYRLLARQAIVLTTAQPDTAKLPNGRVLKTSLLEVVSKDRYRVAASISQPQADAGAQSFLPLLEVTAKAGETFFVAGQSYQGGILVVGITVGK